MRNAGSSRPGSGQRVILRAGDAALTIDSTAGARFASFVVRGLELLVTDGGGPLGWGCYPMAPFAGRIRDGRFRFGGRDYQVETNLPPNAIHGTVVDRAWTVLDAGSDHASFVVDLGPGWPFRGLVRQSIDLRPDGLSAALELEADEPMPAWMGWHPWFRRRLEVGGDVALHVEASRMYARGEDGLPTGELIAPPPGPWDDAFAEIVSPVRLSWPGALALEVGSDAPTWVVYDELPMAVCIEPQTAPPDAIGLAQRAAVDPPTVVPGRPLRLSMTWRWGRPSPGT